MTGISVRSLQTLLCLIVSALLEVGGDAGMRAGLHGARRGYALGAFFLVAYGLVVNLPRWDFGRLLGVYIAVFFVISQLIAALAFHEKIKAPVLVGGLLIVAGGLVLTFWTTK